MSNFIPQRSIRALAGMLLISAFRGKHILSAVLAFAWRVRPLPL